IWRFAQPEASIASPNARARPRTLDVPCDLDRPRPERWVTFTTDMDQPPTTEDTQQRTYLTPSGRFPVSGRGNHRIAVRGRVVHFCKSFPDSEQLIPPGGRGSTRTPCPDRFLAFPPRLATLEAGRDSPPACCLHLLPAFRHTSCDSGPFSRRPPCGCAEEENGFHLRLDDADACLVRCPDEARPRGLRPADPGIAGRQRVSAPDRRGRRRRGRPGATPGAPLPGLPLRAHGPLRRLSPGDLGSRGPRAPLQRHRTRPD